MDSRVHGEEQVLSELDDLETSRLGPSQQRQSWVIQKMSGFR